jgi:hypothetical protein
VIDLVAGLAAIVVVVLIGRHSVRLARTPMTDARGARHLVRREFDPYVERGELEVTPLRWRAVERERRHIDNPRRHRPEPLADPTFDPHLYDRRDR